MIFWKGRIARFTGSRKSYFVSVSRAIRVSSKPVGIETNINNVEITSVENLLRTGRIEREMKLSINPVINLTETASYFLKNIIILNLNLIHFI